MSQRGLARHLGLDAAAVSLMFRGKREMKLTEAAEIARLLGVSAEDVMANAGARIDSSHKTIQITGWVDGSGEVHSSLDAPLGAVPHPGNNLPPNLNATLCRTAGTPLDHMDGWLLFHEEAREGVPADCIGRLSLCKISGGVVYMAKMNRGFQRGQWNLIGPAASANSVSVDWAIPILSITT